MIESKQLLLGILPLVLLLITSNMAASDNLTDWVKKDNRHFLNAIIKVGDLNRSIKFYTQALGMSLLSKKDVPKENSTVAVVGFGSRKTHFVLHLVYVHGVHAYDVGTLFDHFTIGTQDLNKLVEKIRSVGVGRFVTDPKYWFDGRQLVAHARDPIGYNLDLLQQPVAFEPFNHITINTPNLNHSISFYEKALGMSVLLYQHFPKVNITIAQLGWEKSQTKKIGVIELRQYGLITSFRHGNGYVKLRIGTDDVYKSADAMKPVVQEFGGEIIQLPDPNPLTQVKSFSFVDPNGHTVEIMDNKDYLKEIQ